MPYQPTPVDEQLAIVAGYDDDQVTRTLSPFLDGRPNDWMSNDNRMCSHAAMAMRAEGYPDRDILAIIIRLLYAETSWSKL